MQKAIEYLLPSGLFDKAARPMLKVRFFLSRAVRSDRFCWFGNKPNVHVHWDSWCNGCSHSFCVYLCDRYQQKNELSSILGSRAFHKTQKFAYCTVPWNFGCIFRMLDLEYLYIFLLLNIRERGQLLNDFDLILKVNTCQYFFKICSVAW